MRPESALSGRRSLRSGQDLRAAARQLTLVMVQPQRGHSEPCPERQVVPQWEQVEAVGDFPALVQPQA